MIYWVLGLVSVFFSAIVLGEVVEPGLADAAALNLQVTPDFLEYLVASFNGIKGASVFGGAAIVVQLIIRALDQPFSKHFFGNTSGLNKLLIVSALTFAVTPIGLISGAGLSLGAALMHSSTLTTFMVFLNQLYQQAQKAKEEKANKAANPSDNDKRDAA